MSARLLVLTVSCVGCATAIDPRISPGDARPDGLVETHDAQLVDSMRVDGALPDGNSSGCGFSGVLATWTLTGASGSQASTAASAMAPGVTAGAISRSSGLTAASGTGSINSSNWATGAQPDSMKYYTVSIAAPAACALQVTSLSVDVKASGTGPTKAAFATSADGFAQTGAISTTAPSTPSTSITGTNGSLEIRIYGYSAGGAIGTMRVQNTLSVTGTLQ
jgi:hypothetical protein